MLEHIDSMESEFVSKGRLYEDDATKSIYEALYGHGSTEKEGTHLHLLAPDSDFSLRFLLHLLDNFNKTGEEIKSNYDSNVSQLVCSRFNEFKTSSEYKKLQSCYGTIPISKFDSLIQHMCDVKQRSIHPPKSIDSGPRYFFEMILSNLNCEERKQCEATLLRLYIGRFFIENHSPSIRGGNVLEGGYVIKSNILPLKQCLLDSTREGLYDIIKIDSSRKMIQQVNLAIESFCNKNLILLQKYQKLKKKSPFYDSMNASFGAYA